MQLQFVGPHLAEHKFNFRALTLVCSLCIITVHLYSLVIIALRSTPQFAETELHNLRRKLPFLASGFRINFMSASIVLLCYNIEHCYSSTCTTYSVIIVLGYKECHVQAI